MAASSVPVEPTRSAASIQQSCLVAMQGFQTALKAADLPTRLKGKLWERLMYFLHYLVACKGESPETASRDDVLEFLAPVRGLYEYDLRCQMLDMLATVVNHANFKSWHQDGSSRWRKVLEFAFWFRHHDEVHRRSQAFFTAITQADINAHEFQALPFYRAMWQTLPEIGDEVLDTDDEVLRHLNELCPDVASRLSVLDIGCGRGRLLQRVAKDYPNAELIGTELVEWYHPLLRERGIRPIQCDAGHLTLPDESLDIVISTDVIEHLREPRLMVEEIRRVLKPGGIFCVGAPSSNAHFYSRNPFAILRIACSDLLPGAVPSFHNLYAPLTPLKIVHYGFSRRQMHQLFAPTLPGVTVVMKRFYPLRRLRLTKLAPKLPLLRGMGLYCMAFGRK